MAAFREAGSYSGAARLLNAQAIRPRNSRRGWWPSAVAVVVKRLDPSLNGHRASRGYAAGGTDFTLARLLRCPVCNTRLTGTRDRGGRRVRYSCRLGSVTPHPRVSISEHLILPAIRKEADTLATPEQIETMSDPAGERAGLEARRLRVLDMFEAGHIDRADRERRLLAITDGLERLDSARIIEAVPAIAWDAPPRELNALLGAIFERIDLDPETFQPVAFTWRVPEWRR